MDVHQRASLYVTLLLQRQLPVIVTGNLAANKSFSAQPITERFALHCAKIPFTTFRILQNTRVLLSHVASVEPPRVTSRSGESGSGRRPIWEHQAVKFDFTADLTGTGNRSEEVIK